MLDNEKVAAEKQVEAQIGQELKLADKLAIERTVMAAGRTLLAGTRTAVSLIGFGFVVFNMLKYMQEHGAIKQFMRAQTPRNVGVVMVITGTVPLFLMIKQYSRTLKRMGVKESTYKNPIFQMSAAVSLIGIIILLSVLANSMLM